MARALVNKVQFLSYILKDDRYIPYNKVWDFPLDLNIMTQIIEEDYARIMESTIVDNNNSISFEEYNKL